MKVFFKFNYDLQNTRKQKTANQFLMENGFG